MVKRSKEGSPNGEESIKFLTISERFLQSFLELELEDYPCPN